MDVDEQLLKISGEEDRKLLGEIAMECILKCLSGDQHEIVNQLPTV